MQVMDSLSLLLNDQIHIKQKMDISGLCKKNESDAVPCQK